MDGWAPAGNASLWACQSTGCRAPHCPPAAACLACYLALLVHLHGGHVCRFGDWLLGWSDGCKEHARIETQRLEADRGCAGVYMDSRVIIIAAAVAVERVCGDGLMAGQDRAGG